MNLKQYIYLPLWYIKNCIFRQHRPLQTVIFITDYCNLKCKHCTASGHAGTGMKSYKQIREELIYSYRLGSRFVDFEGGEPTLWRDGDYRLNDLYDLARQIGFYSCTLTTNAQKSFGNTKADRVWVSVDGYKDVHDLIRGEGTFKKLNDHIAKSDHPMISINMDINKLNKRSVLDTIRYAKANPHIQSIALNFHTPYPGTEYLMLTHEEKCKIIDAIIRMKKLGYPIMNSISGLRTMQRKNFAKECWISNFILMDGTRLNECAGRTMNICDDCGFCMAGEMYAVTHFKIDTLLSGLYVRKSK